MTRWILALMLTLMSTPPVAANELGTAEALGTHILDFDGGPGAGARADRLFSALAAHRDAVVEIALTLNPRRDIPVPADKTVEVTGLGYTARYLLRDGSPLRNAPPLRCSSGTCGGVDNFLRQVEVTTSHPVDGRRLVVLIGDRMVVEGQQALCEYVAPGPHRWTRMEIRGRFRVRETRGVWRLEPVP